MLNKQTNKNARHNNMIKKKNSLKIPNWFCVGQPLQGMGCILNWGLYTLRLHWRRNIPFRTECSGVSHSLHRVWLWVGSLYSHLFINAFQGVLFLTSKSASISFIQPGMIFIFSLFIPLLSLA